MSDKPKIKNDPENYITVGMAQAKRRAEWLAEQDRLKIAAAIRRAAAVFPQIRSTEK